MRLGGTAVIDNCSFLSNSATTRGLAVAVVGSAEFSDSSFDGNELVCVAGLYFEESEKVSGVTADANPKTQQGNIRQQLPYSRKDRGWRFARTFSVSGRKWHMPLDSLTCLSIRLLRVPRVPSSSRSRECLDATQLKI